MNCRTKFLNTVAFDTSSPVPNWEFAYWADTLERWYGEGMQRTYGYKAAPFSQWVAAEACSNERYDGFPLDAHSYFGFDEGILGIPVDMGMRPGFPLLDLGGDGENVLLRREDGKTVKTRRDGGSMPDFIDYPVKNAADFEGLKAHFNADDPARFPEDLRVFADGVKGRTAPLQLWGGVFTGFYSVIRELMGFEGSLYAFYDDPELVISIQEFFSGFRMKLFEKTLQQVVPDYVLIWEDMAFKNGPMISPALFDEFLLPYYKTFTAMLRSYGVKHIFVDSDGDFSCLIESFIKGGVTGFYPFEVQAGMDVERVRADYPHLVIMGGIDKLNLARGREGIDIELAKVERMLKKGGYIPYTDHMVPPDVSLQDYRYFRERLAAMLK